VGTIVYYDFMSAEWFALSEVAASIQPAPDLEWRGIKIEPGIPSPLPQLDLGSQGRIEVKVPGAVWNSVSLGIVMPKGRPNTRRALTAVAAVSRMNAVRTSAFRVALFRAYWRDGEDLSVRGVVHIHRRRDWGAALGGSRRRGCGSRDCQLGTRLANRAPRRRAPCDSRGWADSLDGQGRSVGAGVSARSLKQP